MRKSSIFLGQPEAPLLSRFGARAIDGLITAALYLIGERLWPFAGLLVAGLYALFADSLGSGQSLGKRIIGLRVIEEHSGLPCPLRASFLRNLPFLALVCCATHPFLWIPGLLVFLPLTVLEIYLLIGLDSAVRLGDVLGNTTVHEAIEWLPTAEDRAY